MFVATLIKAAKQYRQLGQQLVTQINLALNNTPANPVHTALMTTSVQPCCHAAEPHVRHRLPSVLLAVRHGSDGAHVTRIRTCFRTRYSRSSAAATRAQQGEHGCLWSCSRLRGRCPYFMRQRMILLVHSSGTAVSDSPFTGVQTAVPRTPFVDANEQTILSDNRNRIGLGDFTRNDGPCAHQRRVTRVDTAHAHGSSMRQTHSL